MNIDELRSVQSREREAASLQNLRPTFYEDAGAFIADLVAERDRAAERADDPFASPEVRRLTDDIETAKSTVEAIYERRVGKVVKMASIAAAEMPTEEENLTNEERELFDELVERITANREHVLDGVLEGDGPGLSCSRDVAGGEPDAAAPTDPDPSPPRTEPTGSPSGEPPGEPSGGPAEAEATSDAPAGSFMGGDGGESAGAGGPGAPRADDAGAGPDRVEAPDDAGLDAAPDAGRAGAPEPPNDDDRGGQERPESGTDDAGGAESVDRSLVRITDDVGEIFGVDARAYELSTDEVVTLPAANADPLVERGAAERLE